MEDRLKYLITELGVTSGEFALQLGVQPSTISHLLSGRNKPGYEIISKIIQRFPKINPRWLLLGELPVYSPSSLSDINTAISPSSDQKQVYEFGNLQEEIPDAMEDIEFDFENTGSSEKSKNITKSSNTDHAPLINITNGFNGADIETIILFKKDGTFKVYQT